MSDQLQLFRGWVDQPTVDVPKIPVTKASPSPWRHQATAWSIADWIVVCVAP